jgi:hypothetical protein
MFLFGHKIYKEKHILSVSETEGSLIYIVKLCVKKKKLGYIQLGLL